ncbi:hypothetical protein PIIN_11887 [Serendipita indica DSM 11827]|uniref:F-box domain-containing protein n=1 Tax=Serendipita indica (strain DSM 11827) TaxID=1109443 RepID=G4TVJ5_SERID|nr:hypothetical protein PIIN_11887 [Serendipita indica DSM 11827]
MSQTIPGRGLPMEIVEGIIDNAPDGPTFLACSLVCREWLYRCRFYLFQRFSFAAGDANDVLPHLADVDYDKKTRRWRKRNARRGSGDTVKPGLLPAGRFIQSLVITETSPAHLMTSREQWETIRLLIAAMPNVREVQLVGVTEWALERYLDGVLGRWPVHVFSRPVGDEGILDGEESSSDTDDLTEQVQTPRVPLEGLTLRHVRTGDWSSVSQRIAACSDTLRSLRINSLRFSETKAKVEQAQDNLQVLENLPASLKRSTQIVKEDEAIKFGCLERLAIEGEIPGHVFGEQLLKEILETPSASLQKLTVVELAPGLLPKAKQLFTAAKSTIKTLIIHCDSFTGVPFNDTSRTYSFEMDLSPLIRLTELHVVGIRAHSGYGASAVGILYALIKGLSKFPYSTIRKLHILFTSTLSYSPYGEDQWRLFDEVLAMPHIAARLEDVELVGAMSFAGKMHRYMPKTRERRLLRLLA